MVRRILTRLVTVFWCCALPAAFGQGLAPLRVFTTAYPPYAAPALPQQGAAVQMLRDILGAQGMTAIVDFLPWARLDLELRAGHYDAVLLAWPGDLQRHGLLSGSAWFASRLGVYVRREEWQPQGLTVPKLAGRSIGIVRDYAYPDELIKSGLRLELAASDAQNLRKLAAGRIDAVVLERAVGQYLLSHEASGFDAATVVWQEPAISVVPLYTAVVPGRPRSARLQQALEEGLQAYKRSGRYARLLREHDLDAPP